MKAYQRTIREEKALVEPKPSIKLTPENAIVKPVSFKQAKAIILQYEWLKCMPAIAKYCYGLFFGKHLAGVVVYGAEYSENRGVWDKYGFTGKMLLLARGACVHWAPEYAGSMLIRRSMALLPPKYEVITATVDELAGEIGTIYQACGFHYVGVMRKYKERFGVKINGKLYGSRSIRAKLGTMRKDVILQNFPEAEFITQKSKGRYFAFRGSKKAQKQHQEAISHLIKKYPKRKKN